MGILDGIFRNKNTSNFELDVQHALVLIMLRTMQIDKVNHSSELLVINQIMCKSPIFGANTDKDDARIIDSCKSYISNNSSALDEACRILPSELRETAFAMATEIIFADHIISDKERTFVDELAQQLGVGPKQARSIVETFDILYRAAA